MTAWLAAMVLAQASVPAPAGPRVLEVVDPGANRVVVQAFVPAPEGMGGRESAAWRVLGRALLAGSQEFTAARLFGYGGQAGIPPRVVVMPDYLWIQFAAPPDGLDVAGLLTESVVRRPRLTEATVADQVAELTRESRDPWRTALSPERLDYRGVTAEQVRNLWARAFRPERTTIVVGGRLQAGAGVAEIARRFPPDPTRPPGTRFLGDGPVAVVERNRGDVDTFDLRGLEPLTPASPRAAARLMAVFALGVAKESSAFRVLREQQGVSYRQEALLWPTARGWQVRLLWASLPDETDPASLAREALKADVGKWDEATRVRALAMARGALTGDMPFSPFWLDDTGPMTTSLEDRCAWRGYLTMIGSGALDESVLLGAMENVDVSDMRAEATAFLDGAALTVVRAGRP